MRVCSTVSLLEQVKPFLSKIKPRKAVFDKNYVKKLDGPNVKKGKNKMELAEQLRDDIRDFKKSSGADRLVMIWCGSTETFIEAGPVHQSVAAFEKGLRASHDDIAPSMIYAYAALKEGVPFANGAPEPHGRHSRHAASCRSRWKRPFAARTTRPARR